MHYHVIVADGDSESTDSVETFERWEDAENHAQAISRNGEDWVATRYPGRPWREGEVTAYLDRRVLARGVLRREVCIVRCPGAGRELQSECYSFGIAVPQREPS